MERGAVAKDGLGSLPSGRKGLLQVRTFLGSALALLLALVAGCSRRGESKGPPDESRLPKVRVTRVIDGDTVVATRLGKTRLIGVDTPEEGRCYETDATRFTRERLEGRTVGYEFDKDREDPYGRTLAYLYRGGMHNLALVEQRYARALTISPNVRYARLFIEAERRAEARRVGRWTGECERKRRARATARVRARATARARARRVAARRRRAEARHAQRERAAARRARREENKSQTGSSDGPSVPSPPPDLDCSDIGGSVRVGSSDPHRLDADGDGVGCE